MRQKLRQKPGRPAAGQHGRGASPGERRGDLLGAEPGPGPSRSQRPAIQRVQVLVGLANHAGPDGTAAFPSVATLVRCTGLSERTVRTCLDRLEAEGLISPCDPDIVAAWIKRADRRQKRARYTIVVAETSVNAPPTNHAAGSHRRERNRPVGNSRNTKASMV